MASIASVAAKAVAKTVGRSVLRLWDEFEKRLAALEAWMAKGGGGSDMPLMVVTDEWEGTSNTTRTFTTQVMGLSIVNEGTSDLTFTIGNMTLTVGPEDGFESTFNPFTSITITANGLYRALVTAPYNGVITPPVTPPADTTPPVVTISPAAGTYTSAQSITLSSEAGATIYYTTNGTAATTSSTVYSGPIAVNSTGTISFLAKDAAGNVSTAQSATYTINTGTIDTTPPIVTATPGAGTFTSVQTVTLSSEAGATIYYTTNGTTPTTGSTVYTGAIPISATTTLQYIGRDAAGNVSTPVAGTYTINIPASDTTAPTVTASPAGGTFASAQSVTLSANEAATIYYTLDGSTPTTSSSVYSSALTISSNTTLRYFGRDTAGNQSAVQNQTYTITVTPQGTADGTWVEFLPNGMGSTGSATVYKGSRLNMTANGTLKAVAWKASGGAAATPFEVWGVASAAAGANLTTQLATGTTDAVYTKIGGYDYVVGILSSPVSLVSGQSYEVIFNNSAGKTYSYGDETNLPANAFFTTITDSYSNSAAPASGAGATGFGCTYSVAVNIK